MTCSPWCPLAARPRCSVSLERSSRAPARCATGLATSAERVLPPRPAGLLPGLVVGDTTSMDPALDEDFERAGLSHLTAVSGANVAIILTAVLWPLRRRAVDRRLQAVVAVVVLIAFVILAGPSPSVVRAATMGAVTLLALAAGRPRAALPALGAAVCVLLLLDPGLARDAGIRPVGGRHRGDRPARARLVAAAAGPRVLAGPGRCPRGERRCGPGHGTARRRPRRERSAWSPCRPICWPRPR